LFKSRMYGLASSWYGMSRNSLCLGFIVSKEKGINKALDRDRISNRFNNFLGMKMQY